MNNISILTPADLPRALEIEQASHAFPWTEKTLASNQGERYLNLKIMRNDVMAGFAITQIVLDEATLFNIAIDPAFQRQGLGRALLEDVIQQIEKKTFSRSGWKSAPPTQKPSRYTKAWALTKSPSAVTIIPPHKAVKTRL